MATETRACGQSRVLHTNLTWPIFYFPPLTLKNQNGGFGFTASTLKPLFSCMTEEELLIFDLQSLATLAAARALEMGAQEGHSAASGRCFPARRTLNLRRKFNWTPRNEPVNKRVLPAYLFAALRLRLNANVVFNSQIKHQVCTPQVCPAKGSMETMDGPELAMRVKLAELQRRYKEKQKELAKLQRKHDHQSALFLPFNPFTL